MNKNNKTGVNGVYYDNRKNKFQAQINVLGKKIRLGAFQTLSEAQNARNNAEEKYRAKGFIQNAIELYNPTLDVFTAKIIFLISACEHYLDSPKKTNHFKDHFYKRLKNNNVHLDNPSRIYYKLIGVWVGEDAEIMKDFINGKTVLEIAKRFAFSRTQMDRKIVSNLKRLNFKNAAN